MLLDAVIGEVTALYVPPEPQVFKNAHVPNVPPAAAINEERVVTLELALAFNCV